MKKMYSGYRIRKISHGKPWLITKKYKVGIKAFER